MILIRNEILDLEIYRFVLLRSVLFRNVRRNIFDAEEGLNVVEAQKSQAGGEPLGCNDLDRYSVISLCSIAQWKSRWLSGGAVLVLL